MMPHNLHFPSMRVSIHMPLTLSPNAQWVINDYDNTALDTKIYLQFLKEKLMGQQEELRVHGESLYDAVFADKGLFPTIRQPIWGRELYKGSASERLYMPVTLKDLPIIDEVLKRERLNE